MSANGKPSGRLLEFEIFRFNPADPASSPHTEVFTVEEQPYMSLYLALNTIREQQDPSLQFDFACRSAVCGSCGMLVNGRPMLACATQTAKLPDRITLYPLPVFQLVGDLSVDTGIWFRDMAEKTAAWIHEKAPFDPDAIEERMSDDVAHAIYERDRCIECGCCIAACGTAQMRSEFVGAVGLNQVARFRLDPRDQRSDAEFYELVGDDTGVFGCMTLLGCEDLCPKDLPLAAQIAFLRRRMVSTRG